MNPKDFIPLVAMLLVVGVLPIVAILTVHQQKMARLIRGDQDNRALEENVAELKATVQQQAIMLDTIASQQRELLNSVRQSLPYSG